MFGSPTHQQAGPEWRRWTATRREDLRFSKDFKHAQDGGHRTVNGLQSNRIAPATTSMARRMRSLFKMPAVLDRPCKLAIAANGTFSTQNGFHQERMERYS
jgi:hypothetical protein